MEKVSDSDKKKYYLSVQGLSKLYEENVLANKMFYVATDKANTDVSDEEARQAAIQYIEIMTKGIGSSGQKIDMDEKAKAQALKWAEQLQLRAVKTKDFLTLAKDNTDATTQELVVGKSSTKLEKAALDAALALKKGEVRDIILYIASMTWKRMRHRLARKLSLQNDRIACSKRNITSGSISAMLISVKIFGIISSCKGREKV